MLTVTNPDRGHPHQDDPEDLKRGQVYVLRNHLEVVEDLSFLRTPGRLPGPANRKARRIFDWEYGVPDMNGERRERGRGLGRDREARLCRKDDDHAEGHHHRHRRQQSLSAWARNSRCRGGAEDCISSNRWREGSPPHWSRKAALTVQPVQQVWRVKSKKTDKGAKRVSFADTIATELKPRRQTIPDDSIQFIMADINKETPIQEGGQLEKAQIMDMATSEGVPNSTDKATGTAEDDPSLGDMLDNSEIGFITLSAPGISQFGKTDSLPNENALPITAVVAHTDGQEVVKEQQAAVEEQLGRVLDHLQDLLHFARPFEKKKMDAIQYLIEQEAGMKKKDNKMNAVGEAPGLSA